MRKMAAVAFAMTWIFLLAACGDRMNESEAANTALSALESIAEETSESTTGEIPENTAEGVSGNAAEGASGHAFEEGTAQGTAEADSAAESNRVTESGGMAGTDGSTKEGAAEGVGGETGEQSRTLIVFFSRWGNTDYPENVDASTSASIVTDGGERYGSTEYIARLIWQSVGGSLQRIETEESYPVDFDQVVEQNHDEQSGGVLPKLKESGLDLSEYDTVFIGYPVWSSGLPQAVLSFLREYDFTGKTVIPFCTNDGYGPGSSYSDIEREASGAAQVLPGLAVEAPDVPEAAEPVAQWLSENSMDGGGRGEQAAGTAITITIGETVLDGVLFDTALADEIREFFPLTVSMSGFGGREYYGGVDFYPENLEGRQRNFENGHITYCEAHHNMAVFYAQTENPTLSVDVIPIGRVTSDLAVFEELPARVDVTFALAE